MLHLFSIALFSVSALAGHYEIFPGQTRQIGFDTVTCRQDSGSSNDLVTVYHWPESCEKSEDVLLRMPIDWSSKERTLETCKRMSNDNFTSFSHRIGNGPCVRQTVNFCNGLMSAIFGSR